MLYEKGMAAAYKVRGASVTLMAYPLFVSARWVRSVAYRSFVQYGVEQKQRWAPCKAPRGPIWAPCKAPNSKDSVKICLGWIFLGIIFFPYNTVHPYFGKRV